MDNTIIIAQALKAYFKENGIKQKEVGAKIGECESVMALLLNGKRPLSGNVALKLSSAYGFSLPFLLSGEGELMPHDLVTDPYAIIAQQQEHIGRLIAIIEGMR